MKITRDVITDLLPIYLAGEASQDTRDLVETFLKGDPDFAKLVAEQETPLPESHIRISKDTEMQTLSATRTLLRKRSIFLGIAIFFTCFAFAFTFDRSGLHWLWTQSPLSAIINLVLGAWSDESITGVVNLVIATYFWVRYFQTDRKLKGSDV